MTENTRFRARMKRGAAQALRARHGSKRQGWVAFIAALLVAVATVVVPAAPAMAAGTAITLTPATATFESGVPTTYTLTVSCSTDGGCTNSTVTIPTTSITGTPAITDFGSWIGNNSCPGVTKTVSAGQVVFDYGTLPTGSKQCTFTLTAPEYKTFDDTVVTLAPTLASTNSDSSTATAATATITAGHNVSLANSAPARVISGNAFEYTISLSCGLNGQYNGDIGLSELSISATLPTNFEYESYRTRNSIPGDFSYDPVTRTFTYSDPTGTACGNPPLNSGNFITIYVTGTATTDGMPDPVDSEVCNSATASWTYLDGVTDEETTTPACATVVDIATTVQKSTSAPSTMSNIGQFAPADGGGQSPHTYAGDWDQTGASAYFDLTVATVPAAQGAGVSYDIQDPMPCLTNGADDNYTSNAVGTYCTDPAFIPTLIVPTGFAVAAGDTITVIHTDGTEATIPYTANKGWVIPTSPVVAQVNIPAFAAEGANSAATMRFRMFGYASADVPAPAVLTNQVTSTPYAAGDTQNPLLDPQTATSRLQVEVPPADDGVFIYPGLTTNRVGATCAANVSLNSNVNGSYSTRIEIPTAPSKAVYIDYLAPAGTIDVAPAATAFSFTPFNKNGSGGSAYTSAVVTPVVTPDFNGTGRTLVQWKIPGDVVTVPGYYNIRTATALAALTLEAGCAGDYTGDITVGYDAPIAQCYFNNYATAHVEPAPMYPFGTTDLRSNGAPTADNYCGYSSTLKIAAINPGFSVDKTVQGNLDAAPIGSGGTGHVSVDGGTATYQVTFTNTGQSTLTDPVMYDLLPRLGDTRASSTAPRGSQFPVTLTAIDTLPENLTVAYSQAANPCRPEVLPSNPGCVDDWTTTAPSSLTNVSALRFSYDGSISVTNGFAATYSVSAPASAAGNVAWNSIGTNVTAGDALVGAAESSLTGLQAQSAQPALTKVADRETVDAVGQSVEFTFTVTNNTAVTLSDVRVTDALVDSAPSSVAPVPTCETRTEPDETCSGAVTTLAPGQSAVFTAAYTTTQADLDHGSVSDQATATATPPTGPALSNSTGVVTVTAEQNPALTLTKSASVGTVDSVGDVIDYTFAVHNSGNVTLRDVAIDETAFSGSGALSAIACPSGTLTPGATVECTASYPVTQADLTAGAVDNTAAAVATEPEGTLVTSPESSATVDVEQTASLDLVKSASPSDADAYDAGQVIDYTFVVTNTGNVPVTGITVAETQFTGTGTVSAIDCPAATLEPAEQLTCTASYTLTQEDVDSGSLSNTARAAGTSAGGSVSDESTVVTPQLPDASLTFSKTASTSFVNEAGESVTYAFSIRNTGNVTVHDIAVQETDFDGSGATPVVDCPVDVLAPGQQVVCTADYTITQADLDAGGVSNTAVATGLDTADAEVESAESTADVTANAAPAIVLEKSADVTEFDAVDDGIEFRFLVTNTGNVTLSDVEVAEIGFTGSGTLGAIDCPATQLAPGDSFTCTAPYAATQRDLDAGSIVNTALASAQSPAGDSIASETSTATVEAVQTPLIVLEKTATPDEADAAGDVITYAFHVSNDGNVTVTGLEIAESEFSGTGALADPECEQTSLAPGEDVTCEVTYVLTQADVDAGELSNTAGATASAPMAEIASESSTALVAIDRDAALTLVKSAQVDDPEDIRAGDRITYSFVITNSGNVTVADVAVDEGDFTGAGTLADPTCEDGDPLAPGAQLICTTVYTVTQADVDAGEIVNSAVARGTGPEGVEPPTSPISTVTLPAPADPALGLVKSTEATEVSAAGQVITYTFAITNTGNTTAHDVAVSEDSFTGHGDEITVDCPAEDDLLPGQVLDCTAAYTVVAADLDGDALVNTATATSTAPDGSDVVSEPSTARIFEVADLAASDDDPLAATGGAVLWGAVGLGAVFLALGLVMLMLRRRNRLG